MKKQLLTFLLSLLTICSLYAGNEDGKGTITGVITTSDGQPAVSVTVTLKNSQRATITNEAGRFTLKNVPDGAQELEISLTGYETLTQAVNVIKDQATPVKITLSLSKKELEEVVVTSGKNKFTRVSSETVAKMPLKNMENPQVYNSVTRELLQDQVVVTYAEALNNVPGVVMQLENNSAGGTVTSRGFSTQSFFRNNLVGLVGGGTVDFSNVETIEAIKGPSGTLFGATGATFGGVFNKVTKKAFDVFKGELSYTAGGFGLSRFTADVNTPLNKEKTLLLRTNAAKHVEGSFQDAGFKSYFFLAPTLSWKANEKTTVTFDAEYRNEKANSFYRMFADGSLATGVRGPKELNFDFKKRFSGDDIISYSSIANFYLTVDHRFSDKWTSRTTYNYLSSNANGVSGYLSMTPGNKTLVRNMTYTEYSNTAATDIQQNFNGDFKIGKMRNRLLAGLDFYSTNTKSSGAPNLAFDEINASKPGAAYTQLTRTAVGDRVKNLAFNKSIGRQNTYSVYVQDVLNITDQLIAVAGVRIDRFENPGTKNLTRDTITGKFGQTAYSPKFGLVYQIIEDKISFFGNYQNGFSNAAPVLQPDGTFTSFKPTQANQWEGGVKVNVLANKLTGSVSYYNIKVTDIVRADVPDRPAYSVQNGTQYSQGFEVEMTAVPLSGFNVIAGYAYNKSRYEKLNATLDGLRPTSAGPKHTINMWLNYRLMAGSLKGIGLAVGGNYASKNFVILSKGTAASEYALPAYTLVRAVVSYDQPRYRLSFKADNLTDQDYWVGWSTTTPQMPRRFGGSVTFKF